MAVGDVITEAEAVVKGWAADPGCDDRVVPRWGFFNTLAHATWADIQEIAGRTPRVSAPWSGALDALARSVAATVAALVGVPLRPEPATSGGPGAEAVASARALRHRLEVS